MAVRLLFHLTAARQSTQLVAETIASSVLTASLLSLATSLTLTHGHTELFIALNTRLRVSGGLSLNVVLSRGQFSLPGELCRRIPLPSPSHTCLSLYLRCVSIFLMPINLHRTAAYFHEQQLHIISLPRYILLQLLCSLFMPVDWLFFFIFIGFIVSLCAQVFFCIAC